MKILVTGSRLKDDDRRDAWIELVCITLNEYLNSDLIIVHGGALGIDTFASVWCLVNHVPEVEYIPNWKEYGRAAGHVRNRFMFDKEKPDLVLAFWDGKSKGTKGMIDYANTKGCEVRIFQA